MPAVRAVPRVTASLPLPPTIDAVLASVAELAKLPRMSLSAPAPRSMAALTAAAPRVTVSAPVPPVMLSILLRVAVLVPSAQPSACRCRRRDRRTRRGEQAAEGDGVGEGPAGDGLDIGHGRGVGEGGEGQLVGAGAEVDRGIGRRGTQGDGVGAAAAGERFDVGDSTRCWRSSPVSACRCRAEVDGAVYDAGAEVMVSAAVPPMMVSTLLMVPVLGGRPGSVVVRRCRGRRPWRWSARCQGDGVGGGAAGDGLGVGDGGGVGEVAEGQRVGAGAEIDRRRCVTAAPRVMVSSPVPPMRVSTLLTVPVLPPSARVSLSAPAPRSIDMRGGQRGAEGDGVGAGAAGEVSTLATVAVLAKLPR